MSTAQPPSPPDRGARWVWTQSVLMSALVAAGPLVPGAWDHRAGVLAGALIFASGGLLGVVGVWQLGDNRTPFPRPRAGSRLVQTGVYGWIRHPLYVSVMLAGFGWSLIWQSLPALVVGCLQIPFFVAKASREEGWLHHAFPEYASYARRVKRFVPGIY